MTKTFCDMCKKEIKENAFVDRYIIKLDDFQIELVTCVRGTWNGGHLCLACQKKIVAQGKVKKV